MNDEVFFAEDVYFCVAEGHGVFLDLKQDKYSAIILNDTPASSSSPPTAAGVAADIRAQKDILLAAGLLTEDASRGRAIGTTAIKRAEAHIFGADDQRAFGLCGPAAKDVRVTLNDVWDFFLASWAASHQLRTKHIAEIVDRVRKRKPDDQSIARIDELRRVTAIYRKLRPWYPRKYLCLYDSLALVEFLARRDLHPWWVFAVQAQPFGAHCWVQTEQLLLNEGSEYAGQYTPIMAI